MAKKLVLVERKEAEEILMQNLRIVASSSPLSASDYMGKFIGEDRDGICFDNFGELLAVLRAVVTEINVRNPNIKVDFNSGGDVNSPLIFVFTLAANINKSQPE